MLNFSLTKRYLWITETSEIQELVDCRVLLEDKRIIDF